MSHKRHARGHQPNPPAPPRHPQGQRLPQGQQCHPPQPQRQPQLQPRPPERRHQLHPPGSQQRWRQPHPRSTCFNIYSKEHILALAKKDGLELITDLALDIKNFQKTLENPQVCKKNFKVIISLLFKVSSGLFDDTVRSNAIKILGEVFSDRCLLFESYLKQHCIELALCWSSEGEKHLDSLCNFFTALLEKLPDSTWRKLPVDELIDAVQLLVDSGQLSDSEGILLKAHRVAELQKLIKSQQHVASVNSSHATASEKRDNGAFREIEILPTWGEISSRKRPQLRENIVQGPGYDDWMHYFDIQFRLLREDFISPLRKGIGDFKDGKVGRELRNVKLYREVKIVRPVFTIAGLCYKIHFNEYPFRHYRWEHSKHLIFGSLLCLIPESSGSGNTAEVLFATVSNRDPAKLEHGNLEVMFHGQAQVLSYTRQIRQSDSCPQFNMVESTAYYEASRHILRGLQEACKQVAEGQKMPFTEYLISNNCAVVERPQYLGKRATYDIQFIIRHEKPNYKIPSVFTNVAVTNFSQWPTLEMTELDESQLKAIKMALTQEISVIQGPPGTGKTYIGLKIIQALLKNSNVWNPTQITTATSRFGSKHKPTPPPKSPILVMCFTNHALDQFLEGILEMHKGLKLIRIGGRSKSEAIQQCNINTVKRELRNIPHEEFIEMKELYRQVKVVGAKCERNVYTYKEPDRFVGFSQIRCVIDEYHYRSLIECAQTREEEDLALELWLGLYDMVECVQQDLTADDLEANEVFMQKASEDSTSDEDSSDSLLFTEECRRYTNVSVSKGEEGGEETIDITGEATIKEQARLLDDMNEMYKEIQFDNSISSHNKSKKKKAVFNRHTFTPVKCEDYYYELKDWIMEQPEMIAQEAQKCRNLQHLKYGRRSRLYKYWHTRYKAHLVHQLEGKCKVYNKVCERAKEANQRTDKYALQTADVIGITTTGAARYQQILCSIKPKIVIVEEAAEVLESHIVSALSTGTQHLILIGDHKQLRPNPNEYDLAVKYHLDISLFERLVSNDFPHTTLQIQHRMRPEIADLVRGHIYDVLYDHDSVTSYPKVKGVSKNLFFIKHNQLEKGSDDLSHSNQHEADYLTAFCKFLLRQGYSPKQITVLVTYTGQLLLMKKHMPKDIFDGVRLACVDNFQGEENDIILLSLVRSNKEGSVGFLKIENRVCVALSRAKHGFYCIGDFDMLKKKADIWEKIVSDIERKGYVGESLSIHCDKHPKREFPAKTADDFKKFGTCLLPCEFRLECGHVCAQKCHITSDPEHKFYRCKKRCDRECSEGHACSLLCCKPCRCTEIVQRALQGCDHLQEMPCYKDPRTVLCKTRCIKVISLCGHSREMYCYESPSSVQCQELCTKVIQRCGHSQEMKCYRKPASVTCQSKCEKTCSEGHPCPLLCHQGCRPCNVLVTVTLPLCGHDQEKYCHQDVRKLQCMEICEKKCMLGQHPCQEECYKHRPSLGCKPCTVEVEKALDCGHTAKVPCSSSLVKCSMPCPKNLSCGHGCTSLCGEPCDTVKCFRLVEKTLECGHTRKDVVCFNRDSDIECTESCKKTLPCGHRMWALCGEPCDAVKCSKIVKKKLGCGHSLRVQCSEDTKSHKCQIRCDKELACGHNCSLPCSEPCDAAKCLEPVEKTMDCGHTTRMKCSASSLPLPGKCIKPCKKDLSCGHKCPLPCGKPCSTAKCSERIEISIPGCTHKIKVKCYTQRDILTLRCREPCERKLDCGHSYTTTCSEPCITKCMVHVSVSCSQGHKLTRPCFQTLELHPCPKKCKKTLDCGHACRKLCSQACNQKCMILVTKQYPCGHEHRVPCSTPIEEQPCDIICRAPLACGHSCRGKCSECNLTRIHKPCEYSVTQQHFCGEEINLKCVGLRDPHILKFNRPALLQCMHGKVHLECGTALNKCLHACKWKCKHHKCTKSCNETCDRPPCNVRCALILECGHRCIGLCGEPCIDDCPVCDPETFANLLPAPEKFSAQRTYTQLACGHLFTVQDMDKCVEQRPSGDVSPLQCPRPECSSLLSCSYRYGNPVKEALIHIEAVKTKISSVKSRVSAEGKDRLKIILLSNFSQEDLDENPEVFSKACECIQDIDGMLRSGSSVLSTESGFVHFLLFKVFTFASSNINAYKHILDKLTALIQGKSQQLSFQVVCDLVSEVYRLSMQAKFAACQPYLSTEVIKSEQVFRKDFSDPLRRVSKADFLRFSQLVDKELNRRRISTFESAEELIQDVEYFLPVILSGHWKKCRSNHYYCVPVCESGSIDMKCPECTGGRYFDSIKINPMQKPKTDQVGIAEERSQILALLKSKRSGKTSAQGEFSNPGSKRDGKKKKRRRY